MEKEMKNFQRVSNEKFIEIEFIRKDFGYLD